jgi:threonine synthase
LGISAWIIIKKWASIEHFSFNECKRYRSEIFKTDYDPKPSKSTISNAMDVGNQVILFRIQVQKNLKHLKDFSSFTYLYVNTMKTITV